jgi:hypothetical protein
MAPPFPNPSGVSGMEHTQNCIGDPIGMVLSTTSLPALAV